MKKVGLRLALALALTSGCTSSPAGPSETPEPAVAPNPLTQTGTWTGFFRIDTCSDSRFGCESYRIGALVPFWLRSTASASSITAVFDSALFDYPLTLAGTLDADGTAQLAGSQSNEESGHGLWSFTVSEFRVRAHPQSGLAGTLTATHRYGTAKRVYTATVMSASLEPFLTSSSQPFTGTWQGHAKVRRCQGECGYLETGRALNLVIRFHQAGSAITGELLDVWVTGAEAGGIVSVAGEARRLVPDDELGIALRRIEGFSATTDDLGRLKGRFRYYQQGFHQDDRTFLRAPFAGTAELELVTVVRRF